MVDREINNNVQFRRDASLFGSNVKIFQNLNDFAENIVSGGLVG